MPKDVKMTELATRGGARTFSFPRNWYGFTRRHSGDNNALQGWMGWKYGYALPNRTVKWYVPSRDVHPSNKGILAGYKAPGTDGGVFPFMQSSGRVHPHVYNGNYLNVIRWKAPHSGAVTFFTMVKTVDHEGGNGIIYWVGRMGTDGGPANAGNRVEKVCGAEIKGPWSPKAGHISQRVPFDANEKTLLVNAGDVFYMVIGPNSQPNYDSVQVRWDIRYSAAFKGGYANSNLSLREMTEDMARTQVIMPNYRHGQTKASSLKFSDRGESKNVSMGDWVDTTWVPCAVNQSYIYDSAPYNHAGNGSIAVTLHQSPTNLQWWNTTRYKKRGRWRTRLSPGKVTNVMFQIRNLSPPAGVSFLNGIERGWQTGGYEQWVTQVNPTVKGPTSTWEGLKNHPWTVFMKLVGGSYAVDYELYWETDASKAAGKKHHVMMGADSCLKPNNIIIEDLDESFDEKLLYSIFNLVEQDNKYLLISSKKPIDTMKFTLPDLLSRLKNCIIATIEQPDDELIYAIILKSFADRQIKLDNKIIDYIIKRIARSYSKMHEFIYKIDELSLKKKKSINFKIIKEIIN